MYRGGNIKRYLKEFESLELTKDLNYELLNRFIHCCNIIELKKSMHLFREKDEVDDIFIVLTGKVTLYRNSESGQKRVIFILSEGEIINEVILDEIPASITCEAFEDSIIVAIKREKFISFMKEDFAFNEKVIKSMSKKIRKLYRQLKNTVPVKIEKKLAAKLWKLSRDYGEETEKGTLINLKITVTYLSEMLGSSRETVSRAIKQLELMELIEFKEKKLFIKDRENLAKYFKGM